MKKLIIIFGTIIVLINSIAVLYVISSRTSNVRYRMLIPEPGMLWDELLHYSEEDRALGNAGWVNMNPEMAVRVVHMFGRFDTYPKVIRPPYYVVHDEENRIFIVLAESARGHSVHRFIVCQDTGGLLLAMIHGHGGIPRMPDIHP